VRKHASMLALHRDVIALRRNRQGHSAGLTGSTIQFPRIDNEARQIVFWRSREGAPGDIVVVAVHLRGEPGEMLIDFPSPGPWLLRLNTDAAAYGGKARDDTARPFTLAPSSLLARTVMAPYSARIYSLVERPATAAASPEAPPPAPPGRATYFSMYASLNLAGSFNDWSKTAWPLVQTGDYEWEGRFVFNGVEKPSFRLSANEEGVIYWGGFSRQSPAYSGMDETIKRLGTDFSGDGIWDGLYLVRFNEESLRLRIERIGDAPDGSPADEAVPAADFRVWTDRQGKTIQARLIGTDGQTVTLERQDGKRIALPLDRLSPADREQFRAAGE